MGLILNHLRHSEQCDNSTERTFEKLFPSMFLGMAHTLECVCTSEADHKVILYRIGQFVKPHYYGGTEENYKKNLSQYCLSHNQYSYSGLGFLNMKKEHGPICNITFCDKCQYQYKLVKKSLNINSITALSSLLRCVLT
jgi:hypothetical protein